MKSRRVCIKTRSPPASLPLKGQVTRNTTVKWPIHPKILSKAEECVERLQCLFSISLQVLNNLMDRRLQPSLSVLYGPQLTGQLTIAHAHLMIAIAATIYAIPADCHQEYAELLLAFSFCLFLLLLLLLLLLFWQ